MTVDNIEQYAGIVGASLVLSVESWLGHTRYANGFLSFIREQWDVVEFGRRWNKSALPLTRIVCRLYSPCIDIRQRIPLPDDVDASGRWISQARVETAVYGRTPCLHSVP